MSESLYSEAIAEAKQLRDIAEQNAKNAIIEAVTPKIRKFIEKQLVSESKVEDTTAEDTTDVLDSVVDDLFESDPLGLESDEVILDEGALEALIDLLGDENLSESLKSVKSRSVIINALNESVEDMAHGDREKLLKIAAGLKIKAKNLSAADIIINENSELDNLEENIKMSQNETLYEVDLDEIAEMLAQELDETSGMGDEDLDELDIVVDTEDLEILGIDDPDDLDLDSLDVSVMMSDEVAPDEEEDEELDIDVEEDEDVDIGDLEVDVDEEEVEVEELEEVYEIDIDMLREELGRLSLAEAQDLLKVKGIKNDMAHSWGGKGDAKAGLKGAYGGTGSSSGEDFGGGKLSGDPLKVKMNKLSEATRRERRKNRALKAKLNEYRGAVQTLREQLTEMNLFNAKLLYVNKLLQNKNVTPKKRRHIIEALDDARNLREVKLLYKSLTESLEDSKSKKQLSESVRRTLGSSSRTVQSSSSTASRDADEVTRWAKLAGINN